MDKFVLVSFQSAVSSDLASKGEGRGWERVVVMASTMFGMPNFHSH